MNLPKALTIITCSLCSIFLNAQTSVHSPSLLNTGHVSTLNHQTGEIKVGTSDNGLNNYRGWASFDVSNYFFPPSSVIKEMYLKFYVRQASAADHDLVITEMPFSNPASESWSTLDYYFDNFDFTNSIDVYGYDWEAGESTGEKMIKLNENAIYDFQRLVGNRKSLSKVFNVGFWEYDDDAHGCIIDGIDSDSPPELVVYFDVPYLNFTDIETSGDHISPGSDIALVYTINNLTEIVVESLDIDYVLSSGKSLGSSYIGKSLSGLSSFSMWDLLTIPENTPIGSYKIFGYASCFSCYLMEDSPNFRFEIPIVVENRNIQVSAPSKTDIWPKNTYHLIQWEDNFSQAVDIDLYLDNAVVYSIESSYDNTGQYGFRLPVSLEPEGSYRIKITSNTDDNIYGFSDHFHISEENHITLLAPRIDELAQMGSTLYIEWDDNIAEDVKIELSSKGETATTLSSTTKSDGDFSWPIPDSFSADNYTVKISSVSRNISAESPDFSITEIPVSQPELIFPVNNDVVSRPVTFRWNYSDALPDKEQYYLIISDVYEPVFASKVSLGEEITISNSALFADGTYFWQVEAISSDGKIASVKEKFTISGGVGCFEGEFRNVYPVKEDRNVPVNPVLSWDYTNHTDGLEYVIFRVFESASREIGHTNQSYIELTETSFGTLNYGESYKWYVMVKDCNSYIYSDTYEFETSETDTRGLFSNISPLDGSSGISVSPNISWEYLYDYPGINYKLFYGTDMRAWLSMASSTTSFDLTERLGGPLSPHSENFWFVEVYSNESFKYKSPVMSFTTGDLLPDYPKKAVNPVPEDHSDGITGGQMIKLSWELDNAGAEPVDYIVMWWDAKSTEVSDLYHYTVTEKELDIYVYPNITYNWKVFAQLSGTNNVSSDVWTFTSTGNTSDESENISNEQVEVYPNPTNSKIVVSGKNIPIIGSSLVLYNMLGEVVFEGVADSDPMMIILRELEAGIYLLMVDDHIKKHYRKLILNN